MIWCVDDDATIRDIEVYTLKSTGYAAEGFACGADMLAALEDKTPMLIVLDIMMPGEDGVQLLKKLRENPKTKHIPVIMATAKGTEPDKIACLDMGADDYLVKPFGMMEMVSRIKAVLRRCTPQTPQKLMLGGICMDTQAHTVSAGGQKLSLSRKEYDMLRLFLENPGRVFSREELLSRVWGMDFLGETRTVDVHIKTLRAKLGKDAAMIQTVIGVGYRMEAEA